MAQAEWSRSAINDLDEIYFYLARKAGRPEVAKRVDQAIRDHCDEYAALMSEGRTELGTARNDLGDGIRCFTHQRWVILFRVLQHGIRVLAVVDGSQDYGTLFNLRKQEDDE